MGYGDETRFVLMLRHSFIYCNVKSTAADAGPVKFRLWRTPYGGFNRARFFTARLSSPQALTEILKEYSLSLFAVFLPLISSYPGRQLLLHGLRTGGCLDDVVELLWVGVDIVELP